MLDSHHMKTPVYLKAILGFACIVLLFAMPLSASTLREEAVNYRVEGYEAHRRGDGIGAMTGYKKAAALDPQYATPHNDMGVILEEQGQMEGARDAYQKALLIDPNYLEAHANLAMLYERLGEKEKAIYHWLKRYQLGEPYDSWTTRAEDRLVALGVLQGHVGMQNQMYSKRRVFKAAFEANAKMIEEFHAVTEDTGLWP